MLNFGNIQAHYNSPFSLIPISHNLIISSSSIPNKPNSFTFSIFSNTSSNHQILQGRFGFSVSATKKRRKGGEKPLELDSFDEDGEEEGEEDDGVYMPFMGMTEWFQKKPSGFGEGKEYDTSVEDKLMEEIEQSRMAQLANLNKLKNNPSLGSGSKKDLKVNKEPEVVPSGVCVRVGNLPKKRNIHRDLQLAFKGFPAIGNISPAVSGSKKTRDPICRGFAFVYLGSEEAAKSFVQTYSKKSITFGKTQKHISCELANPRHPASVHSATGTSLSTPKQRLPIVEEIMVTDSSIDEISSADEAVALDDQSIPTTWVDFEEDDPARINMSEPNDDETMRPMSVEIVEKDITHINTSEPSNEDDDNVMSIPVVGKVGSSSPKQKKKTPAVKKKSSIKGKSEKGLKSNIPGSTKRLKMKEKAVLADVFSKYSAKASLALKK